MKVRSITYFCDPGYPVEAAVIALGAQCIRKVEKALLGAGYEVQTRRLATVPFPQLLGTHEFAELPRLAELLDAAIKNEGVGYVSLGPALPAEPRSYHHISDAIAASSAVFLGGVIADPSTGIDLQAVQACAQTIVRNATTEAGGFANLRFAALASVPPGSPFFPAAYHDGGTPSIAIATEAADLAVDAFRAAASVEDGQRSLISHIEENASTIESAVHTAVPHTRFGGIDFSLAPFPTEERSIGAALEAVGVSGVGLHGSTAAAAILTEAIQQARFSRAGFSGLMLPVLEDNTLAAAAAAGNLTTSDLLLYSAVCGTGLDTIPLPGSASADEIAPLLLDIGTLSLRLQKPLTARLMPIPQKIAGDPTEFDFEFFAPSRILALKSSPLHGPLASRGVFRLQPAQVRNSHSGG